MTIIAGIDYSIRSPAVCVYDTSHPFKFHCLDFLAMPESKKIDGEYDNIRVVQNLGTKAQAEERYFHLAEQCVAYMTVRGVSKVYLEDYAFGGCGRVFNIGENCGLLKHGLWKANIEIVTIAPTALKKFATGKGNAKKDAMIEQFDKETGVDLWKQFMLKTKTKTIPSPIDDIVDSYFLAKYGMSVEGEKDVT